jgi:integrase
MAKRKRHQGVTLIKPDRDRGIGWRARFTDADTGKQQWTTLDRALTTREQREDWAVRQSEQLAQRRRDLDAGAARATGTPLADAVQRYYNAHPRLRPSTLRAYRDATDKLLRWARRARVKSTDDLTRGRLMAFREGIVNEPKREAKFGGGRGEYVATKEPRSEYSVNRDLRGVYTVLRYLEACDLLPKASERDLRQAFKLLRVKVDRLVYLRPKALQKLLEAAQRNDADTGPQRPLPPVAPFLGFVLLSGCRLGEAVDLAWKDVDLDEDEILITSASKTGRARTVGLDVSPALHRLIAAQKLRTGGKGSVFGLTRGQAKKAAERLREKHGAPAAFTWQSLRRTCGTYLSNAAGIYGGASAYRSARQLGHSVQVAERHYLGVARHIPPDAQTLEAAMQIEKQLSAVIKSVGHAGIDRQRSHTRT